MNTLKTHYNKSIISDWLREITELLAFYKLLPVKVTSNNLLTVEEFSKVMDKLIVFRQKDCAHDKMVEAKNTHPYIIARGPSKKQITHFYKEVEKEIMNVSKPTDNNLLDLFRFSILIFIYNQVPLGFTIGQTFDLLIKVHNIFQMNCDPNLERLFKFCEYFVYGLKENKTFGNNNTGELAAKSSRKFKPSTAMLNLFDRLTLNG